MKTLLISHSDVSGGAARAAYRLHCALNNASHTSRILVQKKISDDLSVLSPESYLGKFKSLAQIFWGEQFVRLQRTGNPVQHTASCGFPFETHFLAQQIKQTDVVHLHWFRETPTISTIGRISKPIVWTLHDMWAFCGAEHYTSEHDTARWRNGYTKNNRPQSEKGFDINRLTWQRKNKNWQQPLHIITPSNWLAQCVSESALMQRWPVHVIPNVLDTNVFKPLDKKFARKALNLPQDVPLVLFGAIKGSKDPRKGFDLLQQGLANIGETFSDTIQGLIFGQSKPTDAPDLGLPVQWMGHVHDEWTLALLYNAADVMVVPSRQENLPQTGTEAQACGCPVVAFNTTGLPDVVVHKKTGYLARPFETKDLAHGISWILEDQERRAALSDAARKRAVHLWSPSVIVPQYLDIYQQAREQHSKLIV